MPTAVLSPLRLASLPSAFDHDDFIFELKYDGFRALAHFAPDSGTRLVSRKGNEYRAFAQLTQAVAEILPGRQAVMDGEIVHFGPDGKPMFYELLRRRAPQHFCAFDLLWLDGKDLRSEPLIERKRLLRTLIPPQPSPIVYVDHLENDGTALFEECCLRGLEGVVAKYRYGRYEMNGPFRVGRERTTWAKIRNPDYSQLEGRRELFERGV